MSSNPPSHQNGKREVAVAEGAAAAEAAIEKLKPLLKPDKVAEARVVLTRSMSKFHSGPIPSAEEMEHLERVHAGAAERCFRMAEKEQEHRHHCDRAIIDREFGLRSRGQWMAIGAVLLLLLTVGYIAFLGDTKAAASLGAATLVGLVLAFTASKYIETRAEGGPVEANVPSHPPERNSTRKGRR